MKPWIPAAILGIVFGIGFIISQDKPDAPVSPPPQTGEPVREVDPNVIRLAVESEKLDAPDEVNLAAWLKRPRAELAARNQELQDPILNQEKLRQDRHVVYDFWPQGRFPIAAPVWRQAKYSAR